MAGIRVRWSVHESTKPYARPFMVTFVDDNDDDLGSVAVSGQDLLYHRQFRVAIAALAGELYLDDAILGAADPQRAWLERLAMVLPSRSVVRITPRSTFDHDSGRIFGFVAACDGDTTATIDAAALHEYQEVQAAVAHQTGGLFRVTDVEAIDDPRERGHAWDTWLRAHVDRPSDDESLTTSWPWR